MAECFVFFIPSHFSFPFCVCFESLGAVVILTKYFIASEEVIFVYESNYK